MAVSLSIIVPIYNVENYLQECLESIFNQTMDDYEVILVNDGSTDNSQAIVDEYSEKYPDKCKAFWKENGGLSDARNYGIQKAEGKYIGFVDSDDYIDRDMYRLMMEKIIETQADVVVGKVINYYMNENTYQCEEKKDNYYLFGHSIEEQPKLLNVISASACNKVYKRKLFEGIEFPKGKIYEDFACIYNVILKAKKIEYVDDAEYYYRHDREGAISYQDISYKTFDIFDACNSFTNFYKENKAYDSCYCEIVYACIQRLFFRIIDARKTQNICMRWRYVNQTFEFLDRNFPGWKRNKYFIKSVPDIKIAQFKKCYTWARTKKYVLQLALLIYPLYDKIKA